MNTDGQNETIAVDAAEEASATIKEKADSSSPAAAGSSE
jgi:hypothetical protein